MKTNYTTGYTWILMPSPGLSVIDDGFVTSSDKVGSGGNQKWKVIVDKPGVYYLSLLHTRTFSPNTLTTPEIIRFEAEDDDIRWLQFDNYGINGVTKNKCEGVGETCIPLRFKGSGTYKFYFWNDMVVYRKERERKVSDEPYSIYDLDGNYLGSPHGGISGKGNGMIFENYLYLGEQTII